MNPRHSEIIHHALTGIAQWVRVAFDQTATWVTQLSWWKFFLFAILMLIAAVLIQETLFDPRPEAEVIVVQKKQPGFHSKAIKSDTVKEVTTDDGTSIRIDSTGLHITKDKASEAAATTSQVQATTPAVPTASGAPAASPAPAPSARLQLPPDLEIRLPPELGREVRDALEEAADEVAHEKVMVAQRKSSEWFINFVLLLVVGLFGTKALMGGKKRAEALAEIANAAAERANLQRQILEARMQVMQAQVEPHFLFNTLASVEYLIETDPPRASAMQRSLIQYLRAVLPQMRDVAAATTLGREADMVRSYLDLLKMRMEERLTVDFRIPTGLRSAVFPPMMLQSLVENAIKHGLERKEQGGTVQVSAEIADNRLRVTVADDGLGFGMVKSDGTGLGLQSVRERLKLLYQDAQLEIATNVPTGVRATIDVPYQLAGAVQKQ